MQSIKMPQSKKVIRIQAIVAMDVNGIIGYGNDLIFHNPQDLKFFKEKTMGHVCIMGRKTFESIGKVLPGRQTLIVTSKGADYVVEMMHQFPRSEDTPMPLVIGGDNFTRGVGSLVESRSEDKAYVCGGAAIYNLFAPYTTNWIVTLYNVDLLKEGVQRKLLPPNYQFDQLVKIDRSMLGTTWNVMDKGVFNNISYSVRNYTKVYKVPPSNVSPTEFLYL